MDIATGDQSPSTSTPGLHHPSADPRLGRAAQRPSISTSHLPATRQTPTSAQTPTSSRAPEPANQSVDRTSKTDVSERIGDPMSPVNQNAPTVDFSHMVPILTRFSELAAIKGLREKEKALLQDEGASIKRRLEKARSKDAFPVVIEGIQAEEAVSQSKIRKLQHDIDENETARQKMAESLRGFLRQTPLPISSSNHTPTLAPGRSPDDETIAKLEAENREMKAELRELKELIVQRSPGIPAGTQAQLNKLENSVNSQSMSNHGTNKRIRKLEEWKEGVDTGVIQPHLNSLERSPAQAPDLEPLRQDVQMAHGKAAEAQERAEAMGERVLVLRRELQSLRDTFDRDLFARQEFEKTLNAVKEFIEQGSDLKRRLESIEKERLDLKGAVATAREAKTKAQDLDTRYTTYIDRNNGRIAHLESTVRQLEIRDKSVPDVEPSQPTEALESVKDRIAKIESNHGSMWNNVNMLMLDRPQVLEYCKQVPKCLSANESLVAAVRSLELRYSNINTEHLVKSMAAAMMEMYPSMSQTHEQVSQLKSYCTKEIAALKTATQNVDLASLDSKLSQLRDEVANKLLHLNTSVSDQAKSISEQLEETWELKNKFQTQSDAFSELGESIPQALQQVERVTELSTKLEALCDDLTSLKASFEDRDVTETVSGLSKQVETLTVHVGSLIVKQNYQGVVKKVTEVSEKLTDLAANYQLLETRLIRQELADWKEVDELKSGHGNLLEELKAVKTRVESQDGIEKMSAVSEKLKSVSNDLKSLQTKFDKELRSLETRVDTLGHNEELNNLKSELLTRIDKFQAVVQSGLNRNAPGDDVTNRAISNQPSISGSLGDHYRILGSAARSQTGRGHVRDRPSISRTGGDGAIATADSSGPYFYASSDNEIDSLEELGSRDRSLQSVSEDEIGLLSNQPASSVDMPIGLQITENENGHHESRSFNKRARQTSPSDIADADDQPSPQAATREIPMASRVTENGTSRKRPRQGSFSEDERRPRPVVPGLFANGTGSPASSTSAAAKKAKKKQEKRERKEQRKKQRQSLPN
ncbi:uncharacterized protein N7496_001935 [Penicillium cataractarum]|uniref:Uncharacterized protein n=1 Tax=Penicillium cataractarum TaxID=2100454 RepID=A0A9W9VWV8_9EURO|nr:uncharacterized protein N7496_001935 [Penicillium cataractarum]KAJ5390867.1 hypothetical protein N7496_001935 [Penicillium cataractarum]